MYVVGIPNFGMFLDASHCLYPEEQSQQTMSDQLTQLNSSSFFVPLVSVFNTTHDSKNYATKKRKRKVRDMGGSNGAADVNLISLLLFSSLCKQPTKAMVVRYHGCSNSP